MAYANLVLLSVADKTEYFCRMRDYICSRNGTYDYSASGLGWTLHDSSYATDEDNPAINDYFVIYSEGESGDEDLYFKITWISGYLKVQGFLYWNATTHASVNPTYNTINNLTIAETGSYELSVYGDLDFVHIFESDNVTNNQQTFWGKLANSMYTDAVATSSSSVSSGSSVAVTVDAVPSEWEVGHNVFIRDNAHVEVAEITDITGSVVTVDSLTYSYTADCKLSGDILYCCNSNATSQYVVTMVGHISITGASISPIAAAFTSSTDPDQLNDIHAVAPYHMQVAGVYHGMMPHMYSMSYTGITEGDFFDGYGSNVDVRYWKIQTNQYIAMKEV